MTSRTPLMAGNCLLTAAYARRAGGGARSRGVLLPAAPGRAGSGALPGSSPAVEKTDEYCGPPASL